MPTVTKKGFKKKSQSMTSYLRAYTVKIKSIVDVAATDGQLSARHSGAASSSYVAQASLELPIFLPQPHEYWGTGMCLHTQLVPKS